MVKHLIAGSPYCPGCGEGADGATGRNGLVPKVGDVAVCAYCGQINEYMEGRNKGELALRLVRGSTLDEMDDEDRDLIVHLQNQIIARIIRDNGKGLPS